MPQGSTPARVRERTPASSAQPSSALLVPQGSHRLGLLLLALLPCLYSLLPSFLPSVCFELLFFAIVGVAHGAFMPKLQPWPFLLFI